MEPKAADQPRTLDGAERAGVNGPSVAKEPLLSQTELGCHTFSKKRPYFSGASLSADPDSASTFSEVLARRKVAKSSSGGPALPPPSAHKIARKEKTTEFVVPFLEKDVAALSTSDAELENFSGIQLKSRCLSSGHVELCMQGRKLVCLDKFRDVSKLRACKDLFDGTDQVVIAVLGLCLDADSAPWGQRQYRLWQLGDLKNNSIGLILQESALETHGNLSLGHVVAVLNPDMVLSADGDSLALVAKSSAQLALLGTAWGSGFCSSRSKDGRTCTSLVNTLETTKCDYHLLKALKKVCTKRMALNNAGGEGLAKQQRREMLKKARYHATRGLFVLDHVVWKISLDEFSAVGPEKVEAEQMMKNIEKLSKRPSIGVRNFKFTAPGAVGAFVEDQLKKKKISRSVPASKRPTLHPNSSFLCTPGEGDSPSSQPALSDVTDETAPPSWSERFRLGSVDSELDVELELSG
ncbi:protein MCM10 homolog isoform X2 [Schistocerca gregaria]|uniref:protein MCM10 homolog isoform X2 n=1 Tax=Schistocerca gregaria TaxID=7010 RepID=UPI00211E6F8A|nr:protein MCM10 homolog isoform X2 [Schistocerca gregaria]